MCISTEYPPLRTAFYHVRNEHLLCFNLWTTYYRAISTKVWQMCCPWNRFSSLNGIFQEKLYLLYSICPRYTSKFYKVITYLIDVLEYVKMTSVGCSSIIVNIWCTAFAQRIVFLLLGLPNLISDILREEIASLGWQIWPIGVHRSR